MFINIKYYQECLNENPFEFIPLTFHIRTGVNEEEF